MQIPSTYKVEHKDLVLEYKLIPLDEELDRQERRTKLIGNKDISDKEKLQGVYSMLVEDIVSISGLEFNGKPVTVEDLKDRKIPALVYTLLTEIYTKHKDSLLGNFQGDAEKNV